MINKIKRKFKTKEGKVLVENFISLSMLQIVGYILPFLTLPYIAKVIGVEKFGVIAFAAAVIVFLRTLSDFGFNYTGIRDISRIKDDKKQTSLVFSTIMCSRFVLVVLSFLILIILLNVSPQFENNKEILLVTFLLVPGNALYPEWFFQAIEKMKYTAILSTIVKIFFAACIFIFVKTEEDYIYIPLLNSIGYLVAGIIAFAIILRKYKYEFQIVGVKEIYYCIKNSTNMFITLILPNLYTNMSTIFLEGAWGKKETGIFDAGNKFIGISQQITDVFSRTFYPFLARRMDKHSLYEKVSLFISVIISISLFLGAELIVSIFYNETFSDTITVIRIMAISPVFIFMMNAYGTNYLVLKGKEKLLRNIVIVCSAIGLLLSYIMVNKYGYIGAATTIVTVWGIRGILTMVFAKGHKKRENG